MWKDNFLRYFKKISLVQVIAGIIIGITINSFSFSLNKIIENKFFVPLEIEIFGIDKVLDYFPLVEGNMWEYEGYIKRQEIDQKYTDTAQKSYRITETVTNKEEIADRVLFTVKREEYINGILDSSYDFGYFVVSNKIYKINKDDFEKIEIALNNFGSSITNALSKEYYDVLQDLDENKLGLFYEFPLSKGLLYGSMSSLVRTDHMYANYVESEVDYETDTIKDKECFKITNDYLCCSSYQIFCKGIGVVEEEYIHNGTVDEYKVNLGKYLIKN